ncbi:protein phyllopod [Drosophila innubila]|uniref:protein phyllopod n=1 Tax=Drosophila innubila TaxID=198719 RepID=UPI00148BCC43|nr:protein phyllopod [Drosophila innubila]
MSADNQVEPVAAMAAAASSSAAGSAPGSASEYLKRTCLICGCQTNQTINIYEPRSGPNIVQLIQAKFKFQPLNEDKFLCFSCNNWLINWHSLQALNSNDAESQSRSQSPSHMGNNSSGGLVQQQQHQQQQQRRKDQPMERARLRPVAQVRPQPQMPSPSQSQSQIPPTTHAAPAPVISYNKRRFGGRSASSSVRGMRKMLRHCCVCGGAMVLRLLTTTPAQTLAKLAQRSGRSQCRKCRESEISKWRTLHRRSVAKVVQLQRVLRQKKEQQQQQIVKEQTLVKVRPTPTLPYQRFQAPRVDGKVVAMFRRLGTTLESEQPKQSEEPMPTERPLRIMSPAKQRPRWTRTLDDDEILLEFDSVISEVLPATATPLLTTARRRLCYQFTNEQETDEHDETETEVEVEPAEQVTKDNRKSVFKFSHQTHVNLAGLQLPQGLSITLI